VVLYINFQLIENNG